MVWWTSRRACAPTTKPDRRPRELADRLAAAGHQCYLVGGTVRDAFLGRESPDIDLTTDARPDTVESIVRGWADHVWLQGARFGTVGCEKDGVTLEITTFRGDVYRPESRKPEVTYADTIEDDLLRRDFTVNAMALAFPEPGARRSVRRGRGPGGQAAAHAAGARDVVRR